MNYRLLLPVLLFLMFGCQPASQDQTSGSESTKYEDLVNLFQEWRSFEKPPLLEGAPDYSAATFARRRPAFEQLRQRLMVMNDTSWPVAQQVDWNIVRAEMNGYDFNDRILQPWVRDPAFYKSVWMERSDVPAHEGPTHHAITELWTYVFPLTTEEKERLIHDLQVIPPLNKQAMQNMKAK